jgi:hypothetical protein
MLDLLVAVRPADRITDYPGICRDDDTARIALLERHGFVRQAVSSLRMIRPLDEKWIGMPGARAR